MSYPIDPFVALARAHGQLALRLAEITRAAGHDWIAATTEAGQSAFGQATTPQGDAAAGKTASAHAHLTAVTDTLRAKAEQHAAETREALAEWQAAWREAFAPDAWLSMLERAVTIPPAAPAAPAKPA
ncbi:hypothetical protein [Sphingomonas azotifigens]|uniref:hypothetical protein n=1 Tax=Sphingomonas azotifigens TaxID=330920 RepID=UPI000A078458|nr:hypothetical protein [Sphingomonas azotifigens]